MAVVGEGLACGNYVAAVDLSAKQFHAVAKTSSGLNLPSAGGATFGVLMDAPSSGAPGAVTFEGMTKGLLGGTVADQDMLTVDSDGKFVKVTEDYQVPCARAFEAGVSGVVIAIQFFGSTVPGTGATAGRVTLDADFNLADIANGTIWAFTAPWSKRLVDVRAVVEKAATTAAKAATITPKIATVAVTGGVLTLTSANMTPIGNEVAATAVTAANDVVSGQQITLVASAVTAFVEGAVTIYMTFE